VRVPMLPVGLILGIPLFLAGCGQQNLIGDPCATQQIPRPYPEGVAAPETLRIADRSIALDCDLWRDFMPVGPPDGRPMIAIIRVVDTRQKALPAGMELDYLWVLADGGRIWATGFTDEERPPSPAHQVERVARCGPKWDPGTKVDILLRVLEGERERYLKASGVEIARTE